MARLRRWKKQVIGAVTMLVVALAALAGLALATDSGVERAAATRPTTTRRPTSTTTTPPPVAPLTGLPQPDAAKLTRPALVLKIDNNNQQARPQVGLDLADVVYEEIVEGGATRFAAVFQSTEADPVGPVRSARTTDVHLVANLNRPLFGYSGANGGVTAQVRSAPLVDVGWNSLPRTYWRQRGRPAPSNLFTNTSAIYEAAPDDIGPPPPLFVYRGEDDELPASAEPVSVVRLDFGGSVGLSAEWTWDEAAGAWKRSQAGTPHTVESGAQIAPQNVVVQFVDYGSSGFADVSGAASPEARLIGEGEAWVLTAGKIVRGRWNRPAPEAVTTFADELGQPIALTPGRTWVELPRPGQATTG